MQAAESKKNMENILYERVKRSGHSLPSQLEHSTERIEQVYLVG